MPFAHLPRLNRYFTLLLTVCLVAQTIEPMFLPRSENSALSTFELFRRTAVTAPLVQAFHAPWGHWAAIWAGRTSQLQAVGLFGSNSNGVNYGQILRMVLTHPEKGFAAHLAETVVALDPQKKMPWWEGRNPGEAISEASRLMTVWAMEGSVSAEIADFFCVVFIKMYTESSLPIPDDITLEPLQHVCEQWGFRTALNNNILSVTVPTRFKKTIIHFNLVDHPQSELSRNRYVDAVYLQEGKHRFYSGIEVRALRQLKKRYGLYPLIHEIVEIALLENGVSRELADVHADKIVAQFYPGAKDINQFPEMLQTLLERVGKKGKRGIPVTAQTLRQFGAAHRLIPKEITPEPWPTFPYSVAPMLQRNVYQSFDLLSEAYPGKIVRAAISSIGLRVIDRPLPYVELNPIVIIHDFKESEKEDLQGAESQVLEDLRAGYLRPRQLQPIVWLSLPKLRRLAVKPNWSEKDNELVEAFVTSFSWDTISESRAPLSHLRDKLQSRLSPTIESSKEDVTVHYEIKKELNSFWNALPPRIQTIVWNLHMRTGAQTESENKKRPPLVYVSMTDLHYLIRAQLIRLVEENRGQIQWNQGAFRVFDIHFESAEEMLFSWVDKIANALLSEAGHPTAEATFISVARSIFQSLSNKGSAYFSQSWEAVNDEHKQTLNIDLSHHPFQVLMTLAFKILDALRELPPGFRLSDDLYDAVVQLVDQYNETYKMWIPTFDLSRASLSWLFRLGLSAAIFDDDLFIEFAAQLHHLPGDRYLADHLVEQAIHIADSRNLTDDEDHLIVAGELSGLLPRWMEMRDPLAKRLTQIGTVKTLLAIVPWFLSKPLHKRGAEAMARVNSLIAVRCRPHAAMILDWVKEFWQKDLENPIQLSAMSTYLGYFSAAFPSRVTREELFSDPWKYHEEFLAWEILNKNRDEAVYSWPVQTCEEAAILTNNAYSAVVQWLEALLAESEKNANAATYLAASA